MMKRTIMKRRVAASGPDQAASKQPRNKRPTTTSEADPTRVLTYRITALNQMPWYANREKATDDLEALLLKNKSQWQEVASVSPAKRETMGVAEGHSRAARQEAANQLVRNHEAVLLDMIDRNSASGVIQPKLTQPALVRVAPADAPHADQLLREVARRLLGAHAHLPQLKPSKGNAQVAWRTGAAFLLARIQVEHMDEYGRGPDMSEGAADAMRAVLREVADEVG